MAIQHFWDEELTPEQTEALLEKGANEVVRRRMAVPAILALEMHKPLANMLAHAALLGCGFIAPILGPELFNDLSRLLSKRENVERLIVLIEQKEAAKEIEQIKD